MKIRVIDRVLLFVLASVALVTGVCAALREFGVDVVAMAQPYLNVELSETAALLIRIAGIAVLVLLSAYLYSVACRRKKKPSPFIDMDSGNKGSIRMSMDSISSLVLQTCGKLPGLSGLKVATVNHEDSVSVDLTFQVEMNRNIPELSSQIQQIVGEVVERNCGVAVRNVCVTVSGFTPPKEAHAALPPQKAEKRSWFRKNQTPRPIPAPVVEAAPEEAPAAEPVTAEEPAPAEEPVAEPVVETVEPTESVGMEAPFPEPVEEMAEPVEKVEWEAPAGEAEAEEEAPELPERE